MKISKRQLRRIIREEKSRLLSEQPISGAQADQMAAAQKAANDVKKQADMMAELDSIASAIEEIAAGMYGMSGPGTVDGAEGDEMAQDLELQTQRLTDFHQTMENYFIAITPE
jgi:hypothetical protein